MISPLDLNPQELEIYKLLYLKMDFKTFSVKYTLKQLVSDSHPIFNITKDKANRIIKKLISENLLIEIQKGNRGNPSIYKLVKINDLIKQEYDLFQTETQLNSNVNQTNNISVFNGFSDCEKPKSNVNQTEKQPKSNVNPTPIKEKDKEKENIYTSIFSYYNSKGPFKHKKLTETMKKGMDKAIEEYDLDLEHMKRIIDRHVKNFEEKKNESFPVKARRLAELFGQKKFGGVELICSEYLDDAIVIEEKKQISRETRLGVPECESILGERGDDDWT